MTGRPKRPLLIGHRGSRLHAPENTFAAFNIALDHGCDGFELDVRLTADGQALVCHDPEVEGLNVAASTYEELFAVSSSLPLLEQVLEPYSPRALIAIELKVPGLEQQTIDLLRRFTSTRAAMISSFLPDVIEATHRIGASVPLGFICRDKKLLHHWRSLPIEYAVLQFDLVNQFLFDELKAAGKKLLVWTVNEEKEMHHYAAMGVHGIISDDTELLGSIFCKR